MGVCSETRKSLGRSQGGDLSEATASTAKRRTKSKLTAIPPLILTIGHSTRTIDEFVRLLQTHGVRLVVDVRTIPRSRHNPQFNADSLPRSLKCAGITYTHVPSLGGLRHANRDSLNTGWRNTSFRGFADYMQTKEFADGLEKLLKLARRRKSALMCAEAVPWRCHRSLIADALLIRGIRVEHILGAAGGKVHTITPFARVRAGHITYPGSSQTRVEARCPKSIATDQHTQLV